MGLSFERWGAVVGLGLVAVALSVPACEPGTDEPDARLAALESTLITRALDRQMAQMDRDAKPDRLVHNRGQGSALVRPFVDPVEEAKQKAAKIFERIDGHYIAVLDRRALALAGIHHARDFAKKHQVVPDKVYDNAMMGFSAKLTDQQALKLRGDPKVIHLQPDSVVFALDRPMERGTDRVDADLNPHAPINFDYSDDQIDVVVAIVDTGIDLDHPDLNVVGGQDFCSLDSSPGGNDLMGHGTHCAGIVGALDNGYDFDYGLGGDQHAISGNAPGTPVFAVRILDADGAGVISDIIEGIEWITACVSGGNPTPTCSTAARNIRVANMSIGCECANYWCWCNDDSCGGNCNDAFEIAIEGMQAAGVIAVVAAGNETIDTGDSDTSCGASPACFDAPMTVASMTDFDGLRGSLSGCPWDCGYTTNTDDQIASYSNYGAQVDIIAPGTCIESTYHLGDTCSSCELAPASCGGTKIPCQIIPGDPMQFQCCDYRNGSCRNCEAAITCQAGKDGVCSTSTDDYCCVMAPYVVMSGTSMASPAVAGGAALFIEEYRKNHGGDPTVAQVKAGLIASGEQQPCGSGAGSDCSGIPGVPGLYLGEVRDSVEVSGYSVDFQFVNSPGFGAQSGAVAFEPGGQSLHMGSNDPGLGAHGYSCVQFCLNDHALSYPLADYLQARFRIYMDPLVYWTGFGVAGQDLGGVDEWQQWWWIREDGTVIDDVDRFDGDPVFSSGEWHDVEIHVDRDAGVAALRVDADQDINIPLANWDDESEQPMRCVFVMSGILDDTVQDVYVDQIYVRAGPDGAY